MDMHAVTSKCGIKHVGYLANYREKSARQARFNIEVHEREREREREREGGGRRAFTCRW